MTADRSIHINGGAAGPQNPTISGNVGISAASNETNDQVLTCRVGEVEVLTLNRPEKLNAWTESTRAILAGHLRRCSQDPDVRAIVLTGAGDRGFCAGQDLSETMEFEGGSDRAGAVIDRLEDFYDQFRILEKPIVAALNGVAAGSGFQIPLLCDVRIAHPAARMGQPEINSGMPSIFGTYLVATYLGLSRTVEMVLSGRLMTAAEALAAGVIHEIVAPEAVLSTAVERATALAAQPPGAVAKTKAWIRAMTESGYRDAFRAARKIQRDAFATGEPQRMMEQFFADRTGREI